MNEKQHLVELAIKNSAARITLHHPPLNILSTVMRQELLAHLDRIEADKSVRVVLFEASNAGNFSVGSDLKEFPQDEVGGRQKIQFEQFLLDRIERLAAVTIASLSGYVLGGGAELMLATDLRIASEDAQIGFPEVKVGGFPAAGGVWRLVRDLGPVRAKKMLLLGEPLSAAEAVTLGLIHECLPKEELQPRVEQIIEDLLSLPQASLIGIKRSVAMAAEVPGISTRVTNEYGRLFLGRDIFEGIHAFLEKRPARFNQASAEERPMPPAVAGKGHREDPSA